MKPIKVAKNAAVFYAALKRKQYIETHPASFDECGQLFGHFAREYTQLPQGEKETYMQLWLNKKTKLCELPSE